MKNLYKKKKKTQTQTEKTILLILNYKFVRNKT